MNDNNTFYGHCSRCGQYESWIVCWRCNEAIKLEASLERSDRESP